MNWQEVLDRAKGNMGHCRVCKVCDGRVCGGTMPGPGAKGTGDGAIRNYNAWRRVRMNMDTIHANSDIDTSCELFGRTFKYPFFAGPVGAMTLHYGDKHTDLSYNAILVPACANAGIAAFTGDGVDPKVMEAATAAIKDCDGMGVPTVKPWDAGTVAQKLELVRDTDCFAYAMDIDAAGLPFLQGLTPPAGSKTVAELKAISEMIDVPFILKGVLTPAAARKAVEAGASAIVVSNHGGRVLDECPSSAEVLPAIVEEVKGEVTILVDGGIRSGADVFKALAMGADGVLIARPFVTAVYGGGEEGVAAYVDKIGAELKDAMRMCGAATLADITPDKVLSTDWMGK